MFYLTTLSQAHTKYEYITANVRLAYTRLHVTAVHRLYQGVLYFQNGTCLFHYTHKRNSINSDKKKVFPPCAYFHDTHSHSLNIYRHLLYRILSEEKRTTQVQTFIHSLTRSTGSTASIFVKLTILRWY